MKTKIIFALGAAAITTLSLLLWNGPTWAAGDPATRCAAQRYFQACAACHSTIPGEHMTGPSLANIWQRKAGTVEDFPREQADKRSFFVEQAASRSRWTPRPVAAWS